MKTPRTKKTLTVETRKGETAADTMVRVAVSPYLRHGIVAAELSEKMMGVLPGEPSGTDFGKSIRAFAASTLTGDISLTSELLTAQAISLDVMFTELARRATMNMGDFPLAAERYARLAFKAQSHCRASLEALAKLHQPREQIVRHVHVNEGGQAVVADHFHHHTGGERNAETINQPHATGTAGEGSSLPSPDPLGNGVPISGGKGEPAMPDARRQKQRRS